MEPSTPKRVALYSTGAVVLTALACAPLFIQTDAEVGTLLSSAQAQAGLAAGIPAEGLNEKGESIRANILKDARDFWRRAEVQDPNAIDVIETGAYLDFLEGKPGKAAENYGRVLAQATDPVYTHGIAIRQSYCYMLAGEYEQARTALKAADQGERKTDLLRARIAQESGDLAEAKRVLGDLVESMGDDDPDLVKVSRGLVDAGDTGLAAVTLVRASIRESERNYETARLKASQGDADNAHGLLTRSLAEQDQRIARRFSAEREFWIETLGEERVTNAESSGAAATPPKGS